MPPFLNKIPTQSFKLLYFFTGNITKQTSVNVTWLLRSVRSQFETCCYSVFNYNTSSLTTPSVPRYRWVYGGRQTTTPLRQGGHSKWCGPRLCTHLHKSLDHQKNLKKYSHPVKTALQTTTSRETWTFQPTYSFRFVDCFRRLNKYRMR